MGKVALVTGSAHRVGKAIALKLAEAGYDLVVHYGGSKDAAHETAREIEALGVEAQIVQANLAQPEEIEQLFDTITKRFRRLDVLVNSAAIFEKKPFDGITVEDWERSMQVNLRAPFLCMQQAAKLMRQTGREPGASASIVNIIDMSGIQAWRGYVQHGVSKAGLLHLTRIAARELAPDIRVNAIAPGPVMPPPGMEADSDEWAAYGDSMPLRRPGTARNVADAVLHLAQNDYITGALLHIDGGEHLMGPVNHL